MDDTVVDQPVVDYSFGSHRPKDSPADCRVYKICWLGPIDEELGWLYQKILDFLQAKSAQTCIHLIHGDDSWGQLRQLAHHGVNRVVIACEHRWDYSWEHCRRFTAEFPEIPMALAMSDWWLGARRTGIGHPVQQNHVCLPWFRWWDGWIQWLKGEAESMFGPLPSSIPCGGPNQQIDSTSKTILLIAKGQEAICSWQMAFKGHRFLDKSNKADSVDRPFSWGRDACNPDWILWDDSQLNTCHGSEANLHSATEQLKRLQAEFPGSRLIVAWTAPRWSVIEPFNRAGIHFELLAKPFLSSLSSAALLRI